MLPFYLFEEIPQFERLFVHTPTLALTLIFQTDH